MIRVSELLSADFYLVLYLGTGVIRPHQQLNTSTAPITRIYRRKSFPNSSSQLPIIVPRISHAHLYQDIRSHACSGVRLHPNQQNERLVIVPSYCLCCVLLIIAVTDAVI